MTKQLQLKKKSDTLLNWSLQARLAKNNWETLGASIAQKASQKLQKQHNNNNNNR